MTQVPEPPRKGCAYRQEDDEVFKINGAGETLTGYISHSVTLLIHPQMKGSVPMSDYNSNGFSAPEDSPDGSPTYLPFGEDLHGVKGQLKNLPNPYKGYNFRSQLEVQWAAFWDHLAIEWHYEHQGFMLAPFGDCYRPDFYLPEL